jgi:hypothetical protein
MCGTAIFLLFLFFPRENKCENDMQLIVYTPRVVVRLHMTNVGGTKGYVNILIHEHTLS